MSEEFSYRETYDFSDYVDKIAERIQLRIDAEACERVSAQLAELGYVKVVRCRDCDRFPKRCELCDDDKPEGYCFRAVEKEMHDGQ